MSGSAINLTTGLLLLALVMPVARAQQEALALVFVEGAGGCRISCADLPAPLPEVPLERLRIRRGSRFLPIRVTDDGDGVLGTGDEIAFIMPPSPSKLAKHAAVWVEISPAGADALEPLAERLVVDEWAIAEGRVFDALVTGEASLIDEIPGGHWFLARVRAGRHRALEFELPRLAMDTDSNDPVTIAVSLRGRRAVDARIDVRAQAEGPAARLSLDGPDLAWLELQAPASALSDGTLELKIANVGEQDALLGEVIIRAPFILELERMAARVIRIEPPPALLPEGGDIIMLTRAALAPALAPLVAHRRRQGLDPVVVTLEQVMGHHADGDHDPEAIERFVREALETWDPAPRMLLLAGDADHDSDRFRPFESLPVRIVEVQGDGGAASDAPHGVLDDLGVPQVAVGRLPVRSREELEMLVERIIAYEDHTPAGTWRRRLSLVFGEGRFGARADRTIEAMTATLVSSAIPPQLDVDVTFASADSPFLVPPDRLSDEIIASLNRGALLFAYVGHGSRRRLDDLRLAGTSYPILDAARVPELSCGAGPPLVFFIACSTGEFDHPRERCLAEEALMLPDGPIGVIAASRISYPYANAVMAKEIIDAFLDQPGGRLGDSMSAMQRRLLLSADPVRAMIDLAALGLLPDPHEMERQRRDQILLYNLLGDPALVLARPRGRARLLAPHQAVRGERMVVTGEITGLAEEAGVALVTLEVERRRMLHELMPLDGLEGASRDRAIAANHGRANDKVLARVEVEVHEGRLEAILVVPRDAPAGVAVVKVHVTGGGDASSSTPVEILPSPPGDDDYF